MLTWVALAQQSSPPPTTLEDCDTLISDGKYVQAEALARSLLAEAQQHHWAVESADILDLLTKALYAGGKPAQAIAPDAAPMAVSLKERLYGPLDPRLALSLTQYATALRMAGRFSEAREAAERALLIYDSTFGPGDPETLNAVTNIATQLYETGDYAGCLPLFERVLIARRSEPLEQNALAMALNDAGIVLWRLKEYGKARPLLEEALAIRERTLSPDSPFIAASLNNLVLVLKGLNEFRSALPLAERAQAIREKTLGPNHPRIAIGLNTLASLWRQAGELERARDLLERAFSITAAALGPEHPEMFTRQINLAEADATLGNRAVAFAGMLHADGMERAQIRLTVPGMAEREALAFASRHQEGERALDFLVSLAAASPALASDDQATIQATYDALIRGRALVFDEMAARRHTAAASQDPVLAARLEAVASSREKLSAMVVQGPGRLPADEFAVKLRTARSSLEAAERQLAAASRSFRRELTGTQAGWSEVARQIPAGATLVSYVRYCRYQFTKDDESCDPHYAAFTSAAGHLRMVDVGAASRIEAAIVAWRNEIDRVAAAAGVDDRRREAAYRVVAKELRRLVWDPLQLPAAGRVFIVPDGQLYLVTMAALPDDRNGYLIDRPGSFHYLSTERDLVREPEPPGDGLLAVGDPDFERPQNKQRLTRASSCQELSTLWFDRLPATAQEIRDVAAIWNRAFGAREQPVSGAAATETVVKQRAAGRRVIHLATHGFFLTRQCPGRPGIENPLLRAGLAFAGANPRTSRDDGILTAEEIASLDLASVEWAVLSGCDTGAGEVTSGEGVFGLRRAFQNAGAHTVIMSLWPVDDQSARLWMTAAYTARFLENSDTAKAIESATRQVLRARRAAHESTHPFYWAPFIAAGDWR